ncbi:MAG: ABC transporter substrate-binding protein [Patescibacteria group bacterium]
MNKIIGWIVVILVVIGLGVWVSKSGKTEPAPAPAISAEPIKIGVIAPLSGTAAIYGEDARNAILLAVEEINSSGGVLGRSFEMIVEDGKCDGKSAINAWQKLVNSDKVSVILGGHCSTETMTIAPQSSVDKVLVLANLTSVSNIPNEGEWVFRNSVPSSYYAQEGAKYVFGQDIKSIAVITEKKEFAVDFSENFKTAFQAAGGVVVFDESFSPGVNDFRTIVQKLKTHTFDGILIGTQGPETMGLIVKQLKELGVERPTAFNAAFSAKKIMEVTGGYLPPKHFAFGGLFDREKSVAINFLANYEAKYGRPIAFNNHLIALVYDMPFRLKAAIESCGNQEVECLRDYFKRATTWDGVAGRIIFGSDHKPTYALALTQVIDGKETFLPMNN